MGILRESLILNNLLQGLWIIFLLNLSGKYSWYTPGTNPIKDPIGNLS